MGDLRLRLEQREYERASLARVVKTVTLGIDISSQPAGTAAFDREAKNAMTEEMLRHADVAVTPPNLVGFFEGARQIVL